MAWYAYGYFVWTPNGVVHSGHDFGPTLDTYMVGDSLGVRSGVEGIVIGILKGEPAKKSGGYDVFVLVGQREPCPPGAPAVAVQVLDIELPVLLITLMDPVTQSEINKEMATRSPRSGLTAELHRHCTS